MIIETTYHNEVGLQSKLLAKELLPPMWTERMLHELLLQSSALVARELRPLAGL